MAAEPEPLSYRQAECLDEIARHIEETGSSCTQQYLAARLSVSQGRVHQHVRALSRKGWLRSTRPLRPSERWIKEPEHRHEYLVLQPPPKPKPPPGVAGDVPRRLSKTVVTPRQAEILKAIEEFYALTREGCPVTHLAEHLGLHHETVREHVAALFTKGLVLAPGSPVTPTSPQAVPCATDHRPLVYVILDTSARLVKIGRTGDLEIRFLGLRAQMRSRLILMGAFDPYTPYGALSERAWHRRFRRSRASGEWFRLTADLCVELRSRFGIDVDRLLAALQE